MTLIINPFTQSGNCPEQAIISQSLASQIFSPLTRDGGAVEVYGERGLGKSTILRCIANPLEEWQEYFKDRIFVFLNCQDTVIPPSANEFWIQIAKELERKLPANPIKDKCRALLARATKGLEITHNDFHEVLDVAGGASKKIVLVLDDFNVLIQTEPDRLNNTRAFLQGLRSLTTRDTNQANLVVSTRYTLYESCKPLALPNYSAFDNGFSLCRLSFFNKKELLHLLERVLQTEQPEFNSAEQNYVAYLSGFHPQLAQIAAAQIFDRRMEEKAPLDDLSPVGERFKSEASPIFETLFQGASELEKILLMLVALQSLKGKVTGASYDITDLPNIFSEREREINDLTERGLLNREQDNPPQWEIFSPIFQWWILKEIESEDPEQLEARRKVWGNLLTQKRVEQVGTLVEFIKKNRTVIENFARFVLENIGVEIPL
ncbi:MAG: ATP-binding protein [Cyanobacteria bacterium SBLK]|nr:ATP-binding protein [Cyanobacteria bacterium SBLK]